MRIALFPVLLYVLVAATGAEAANADAREVARINNCPPKKIEVYQQTLGIEGKTIYRVECNLPKAKEDNAVQTADALLVQCNGALCAILRPVASENK